MEKPQYKIHRIEKLADDGTGRTVKVWRVIDEAEGGGVTDFSRKSEARDFADEMNEREERKPHKPGTAPDTSLWLGEERRAWLKKNGGIQPMIHAIVDRAMKRNP
jgi:cyclophilin family peptidyl-prolyl cis-trans isomerase